MHRNKEIIRSFLWQLLLYGISVSFHRVLAPSSRHRAWHVAEPRALWTEKIHGTTVRPFSSEKIPPRSKNVFPLRRFVTWFWLRAETREAMRLGEMLDIILFVRSFCWLTVEFFLRFLGGSFHGTIFMFQEISSLFLQELFSSNL